MLRSMIQAAAAVALFGVVHSLLASRPAKRLAERALGPRNRAGLYRPFFVVQSLGSFALLVVYIRSRPSRELYRVRGPSKYVLYAAQAAALLYAVAAARQVGTLRIVGAQSLGEWLGSGAVDPEPEAQGPAMDETGRGRIAGPFAISRHPLNLVPIAIFWLQPRMTTNLLAFNAAATAYLALGSVHEERRLLQAYGRRYEAYRRSGVPFFLPALVRHPAERLESLAPCEGEESPRIAGPAGPIAAASHGEGRSERIADGAIRRTDDAR